MNKNYGVLSFNDVKKTGDETTSDEMMTTGGLAWLKTEYLKVRQRYD